jgi:alkyl hydroperoxide reductase subunit F
LRDITALSPMLTLVELRGGADTKGLTLRSPISFSISSAPDDDTTPLPATIIFSGIPGRHEFNSLVLAILHVGGHELKLSESVQSIIKSIEQPLHFEIFVSLGCHNCPDVVQALNRFSVLNPNIRAEMIDGALFPDLVAKRNIQGVPSVYVNGEPFATGKVDTAQ